MDKIMYALVHVISYHNILMLNSLEKRAVKLLFGYRVIITFGIDVAIECWRLRTKSMFACMIKRRSNEDHVRMKAR